MTDDCVFCKIAAGEIAAKVVRRDADILAIEDISPQSPTHLLVFPRKHVRDIAALAESTDNAVMAEMFSVAAALGSECGPSGFRIVVNAGEDGGQTVGHVHAHVLAGRRLLWPPG